MIRVSFMYPNEPGKKFDLNYFVGKHMATVDQRLTPFGLVRSEVDKGLGTGAPDKPAPFIAAAHLYYNSMEDFQKGLSAHGAEITADVPNYTDIQPQVQISEIVK